jgi:hypothetical protein
MMFEIIAASILAFATNTVPVNAPQPATQPLPKLTCGGFGTKEVIIFDNDHFQVPAGTIVKWELPAETHQIGGGAVYFPPASGFYEFQQPLNPGGQLALNAPLPAPASGGPGGPQPPPELVALVIEFFRGCNISYSTRAAMLTQQMQVHSVPAVVALVPATPTAVTIRRTDANTVHVTWNGGLATAHFSIYDLTTASSPPTNYHSWQNPVTVAGNVLTSAISIPAATKPQINYYMVCATNANANIVNCSAPAVESALPYSAEHPLVHPH